MLWGCRESCASTGAGTLIHEMQKDAGARQLPRCSRLDEPSLPRYAASALVSNPRKREAALVVFHKSKSQVRRRSTHAPRGPSSVTKASPSVLRGPEPNTAPRGRQHPALSPGLLPRGAELGTSACPPRPTKAGKEPPPQLEHEPRGFPDPAAGYLP